MIAYSYCIIINIIYCFCSHSLKGNNKNFSTRKAYGELGDLEVEGLDWVVDEGIAVDLGT